MYPPGSNAPPPNVPSSRGKPASMRHTKDCQTGITLTESQIDENTKSTSALQAPNGATWVNMFMNQRMR